MIKSYLKAFTLIELLIVIAVIAILAVGAFVALNPGKRLADTRDATRWTDVTAILDAAKVDQVDNGGSYLASINALVNGTAYMIGTCTSALGNECNTPACPDQAIAAAGNGVDITGLVTEGYMASVPIAQTASGGATWSAVRTGYYMIKNANGTLKAGACDSENAPAISVQR